MTISDTELETGPARPPHPGRRRSPRRRPTWPQRIRRAPPGAAPRPCGAGRRRARALVVSSACRSPASTIAVDATAGRTAAPSQVDSGAVPDASTSSRRAARWPATRTGSTGVRSWLAWEVRRPRRTIRHVDRAGCVAFAGDVPGAPGGPRPGRRTAAHVARLVHRPGRRRRRTQMVLAAPRRRRRPSSPLAPARRAGARRRTAARSSWSAGPATRPRCAPVGRVDAAGETSEHRACPSAMTDGAGAIAVRRVRPPGRSRPAAAGPPIAVRGAPTSRS